MVQGNYFVANDVDTWPKIEDDLKLQLRAFLPLNPVLDV